MYMYMMYVLEFFSLFLSDALNRYFLIKKLENTALTNDKLETEKRKRASHERKKEVC
jgi:hypothetical protein